MIREYREDDTDALVAIWRSASVIAHPFLSPQFVEQEASNLRKIYLPHAQTWVTEYNNKPVGFIAMIDNEIGGLFLDPDYHGRKLGKNMVDYAVEKKGHLHVEVFEKNAVGRRFYDRYGFVETGRYLHEASQEMTLKLAMGK